MYNTTIIIFFKYLIQYLKITHMELLVLQIVIFICYHKLQSILQDIIMYVEYTVYHESFEAEKFHGKLYTKTFTKKLLRISHTFS